MVTPAPFLGLVLSSLLAPPTDWSPDVEAALVHAGANRPAIESVLEHYAGGEDVEKLAAAQFLIANMPGHGSIDYGLFDAEGNEVHFSALEHANYNAALAAMDALEAEHGPLDFKTRPLVEDLHVLTAEALIGHIDLAFTAWREHPWARDLDFDTFCEHVLPHRGSNEPAEDWRSPLMAQLPDLLADLGDAPTAAEVAGVMQRFAAGRVGFTSLYYLHPTDQGFAEMSAQRRGRCEDITNMTSYALRAAAVASAADYTPYWAHRDNNHAWPVILDANGRGRAGDGNRAAKVYRKTYSKQRANLAFQLAEGEQAPKWLNRETYRDVTDQYFDTTDVTVALAEPGANRFAYLCVFNGGEWRPIHWGHVADGAVTFDRMNGGLLYLPAYYVDGEVVPAAPPFFLTAGGETQPLDASDSFRVAAELPAADGVDYELFVWEDEWRSLGAVRGGESTALRDDLPAGGLYWLVADGSRRLERPFRVLDGERVHL